MVAEVNVNRNQGFSTWGLGLQHVATTKSCSRQVICVLGRGEGAFFLVILDFDGF